MQVPGAWNRVPPGGVWACSWPLAAAEADVGLVVGRVHRRAVVGGEGPDAGHGAVEPGAAGAVLDLQLALRVGRAHHVRGRDLLRVERDGVARPAQLLVGNDLAA